jgi:RNA polymerase sigma-70 factor (ECF subfamily)
MGEMEAAGTMTIERVQDGSVEAFRVIVEQNSRQVFRLAYRMTGNEQDAEDVVQETFFRAYRQFGRFDSRAQVGSWLHKIASNYAIDLLRRRKRWRKVDLEQLDHVAPLAGTSPGPDRGAWSAEVRDAVQAGLGLLTPRERVAFTLRHYEGFSIREIGRAMGLRESATKNYIFRAVRKMRKALTPLMSEKP